MAKFNVTQKRIRAKTQKVKRAIHGDPKTGKLKQRAQSIAISGKRKRKFLKKMKRNQKAAMEKGLVTMEDVEMIAADGASQDNNQKGQMKFHVKKGSRLRIKNLKGRGKSRKKSSKQPAVMPVRAITDAMVE